MVPVYNLKMDPGEQYDRIFGGAALNQLNDTFKKYPNIPIVPGCATFGASVPSFVGHNVFEGKWPQAEGIHPEAKKLPLHK